MGGPGRLHHVYVKVTSPDGLGAIGAGEGIAAQAVAGVEKLDA